MTQVISWIANELMTKIIKDAKQEAVKQKF